MLRYWPYALTAILSALIGIWGFQAFRATQDAPSWQTTQRADNAASTSANSAATSSSDGSLSSTPETVVITPANTSPVFAQGITQGIDLAQQAFAGETAAVLASIDALPPQVIENIDGGTDTLVSDLSELQAIPPFLRGEVTQLQEDLELAQSIAQTAIAERDAAKRELVSLAEQGEAVAQDDALAQAYGAERTRLIASLALEQQKVEALSLALGQSGGSVEVALADVAADDGAVDQMSADLDRLTDRTQSTITRLASARADVRAAQDDLANTLEQLEQSTTQLSQTRTALDETQAEFVDLEAQRLTLAGDVAALEVALSTRRAQLGALDSAADASSDSSDLITSLDASTAQAATSSQAVNDQMLALASKVAELEGRLTPLQTNFESQVQQQATLRAETIAEGIAQERAQVIAADRAIVLADELAQELADQLAQERATILADLIAEERLGEMTPEEIEALAGYRVVDQDATLDTIAPIREYLYEKLIENMQAGAAAPRRIGERLLLSTNTLFPVSSVNLSAAGQAELREFGAQLIDILAEADQQTGQPQFQVQVNGHADRRPFLLSRFGNWELSSLRAVSVVEFLIEEVGVPADRLIAAGFAEHQPLVEGDDEEAYALNRRIEFRLVAR